VILLPKAWEVVRSWLHQCTEGHRAYCKYQKSRGFVPTRLIHRGSGHILQPRLCVTSNLPKDTKYMTLSHCWGNLDILKLENSNMREMMQLINISQLCQTFLDAMEVAKALGLEYIWIDRFCILQGSLDDWAHESAVMGDVYGNSWCNIAATNASDGSHEMLSAFCSRKNLSVEELKFKSEGFVSTGGNWHLWQEEIDHGPLRSRGWVVQELVLSPRVLHFGKHQMFWDCAELRAYESLPTGPPPKFSKYSKDIRVIGPGLLSSMNQPPRSIARVAEDIDFLKAFRWMTLVEEYSACSLTVPSDKLVHNFWSG
jgi:Heterokaryon incompatibility protein (HET)